MIIESKPDIVEKIRSSLRLATLCKEIGLHKSAKEYAVKAIKQMGKPK